MAIKNTNMGGSDWGDGEVLKAEDLNDTYDATFYRDSVVSQYLDMLTMFNGLGGRVSLVTQPMLQLKSSFLYNLNFTKITTGSFTEETSDVYFSNNFTKASVDANFSLFNQLETDLNVGGTSSATLTGTSSVRSKTSLTFDFLAIGDSRNNTISLTDGTNTVQLDSYTTSTQRVRSVRGRVFLSLDWVNGVAVFTTVYNLHDNDGISSSGASNYNETKIYTKEVSISPLVGDNVYFQVYTPGDSSFSCLMHLLNVREYVNTLTNPVNLQFSPNSGANWCTANKFSPLEFGSTNKLRFRVTGNLAAGEGIEVTNVLFKPM